MNTRDISDDHVPSGPPLPPGLEDYVHIPVTVKPPPPPQGIEHYVHVPVRPGLSTTPHPPPPGFSVACGHWAPYYRGEANSCEYFDFNDSYRQPTWWSKAPLRPKSPRASSLKAFDDCRISKCLPTQRELDMLTLLMQDNEFPNPGEPSAQPKLSAWLGQEPETVVQHDYELEKIEPSAPKLPRA